MKYYSVQMEVAGPLAMFARPDTGGTPVSYPAPTWSATKGIFESIAHLSSGDAWICPVKVEVCRRIGDRGGRVRFQRYTTNYGGPLRKRSLSGKGPIRGGSSMQLFSTVLSDVCYRLYGVVMGRTPRSTVNVRHHLQDLFTRRLERGQCYRTPCLGWSEFTCWYWGPFRETETEVDTSLSIDIPSMLVSPWDRAVRGAYSPRFSPERLRAGTSGLHSLRIERGALDYGVLQNFDATGALNAQ